MVKIILVWIISLISLVAWEIFTYFNGNIQVELLLKNWITPLWFLLFVSLLVGLIFGCTIFGTLLLKQNEKFSALARRNEKKEISADKNEAKIKVLENKISSLEKALEDALKK